MPIKLTIKCSILIKLDNFENCSSSLQMTSSSSIMINLGEMSLHFRVVNIFWKLICFLEYFWANLIYFCVDHSIESKYLFARIFQSIPDDFDNRGFTYSWRTANIQKVRFWLMIYDVIFNLLNLLCPTINAFDFV